MAIEPEPPPEPRPAVTWAAAPPETEPGVRPGWAIPVFAIGLLCSLVVAWVSAAYFAKLADGMPPSLGLGYTMALAPFLLVAPILLWVGGLAAARPWSGRRSWLKPVIVVAVIAWMLLMLQGPSLLPT